jgi:hypothetical protein
MNAHKGSERIRGLCQGHKSNQFAQQRQGWVDDQFNSTHL